MALELFPERDCVTCTDKFKGEWGCNGNAPLPIEIDGELLSTCIRRPVLNDTRWFNEMFSMYKMYKAGFLPNDGSYLAQPPSFLQIINVIDATLADCDTIREDERKAKEANRQRASRARNRS